MADVPTPRRFSRPRWLDPRVIGGLVLLVVAVVVGARVVGSAQHTTPVWVAAHDLATGTELQAGDLVPVDVNLGGRATDYLTTSQTPLGRVLNRPVGAGELLPAGAVTPVGDQRVVAIPVDPAHMPPGVQHGSVIDLYLTVGSTGGQTDQSATTLLQSGITVQSVTAPASGGLSGAASTDYQVSVLLAPDQADALVKALPKGAAIVVLRS